jgi:chromosome segregation ATPase
LEFITVNCPKCGFEQEERLDCKKCGIVFSKYTALHFPDKLQNPEDIGHFQAKEIPEEDADYGLMELRQTLRDLSRRFSEIEFERAQRHQLRTEIKNLEQKFQEELASLASRMDAALKLWEERAALQEPKTWPKAEFDQLLLRVEALEGFPESCTRGLDALKAELAGLEANYSEDDPRTSDAIAAIDLKCQERLLPFSKLAQDVEQNDAQCKSLETDMRKMQQAVEAMPKQQIELKSELLELNEKIREMDLKLESISNAFNSRLKETEEDKKSAIEHNVQSILESLDNLRCSVASLTPRS